MVWCGDIYICTITDGGLVWIPLYTEPLLDPSKSLWQRARVCVLYVWSGGDVYYLCRFTYGPLSEVFSFFVFFVCLSGLYFLLFFFSFVLLFVCYLCFLFSLFSFLGVAVSGDMLSGEAW